MPTTPPQIDPEHPGMQPEGPQVPGAPQAPTPETSAPSAETPQGHAPLSVVPHEGTSKTVSAPVRIRTNRFGHLEEHELIKLLDTIEDERARGRFRESIYISLFVWLAIAWVLFYGPKYLWHSPQLITPADALHQQEVVQLNAPVLPHHAFAPAPKIDRGTIAKVKAMAPAPTAAPPAPVPTAAPAPTEPSQTPPAAMTQPTPPVPSPALPLPSAPRPAIRSAEPEAPTPQPSTRPNFNTGRTANDDMQQAMQGSQSAGDDRSVGIKGSNRGTGVGSGAEILSDTQGVNFQPYLQRIIRLIYQQWIPLLPEEARPPLNKRGTSQIRFTINPDGTIAAMHLDGSSHDDALNRAAWGSITGVGQFPPLPKQFHGPNLELRIHYLVNQDTEQ
ncbi:TonB family protein [Granulicella sp. L46]|uniref:TonB family protein n=1 Tax=Granulicella sp. L46 TaxID=1641865 RepID=UPI0020B10519|nr:TonB family protein [Granulicella sp. L46]